MTSSPLAMLLAAVFLGGDPAAVVRPFESPAEVRPAGRIDELVFARLKKLGIRPARLCSDEVFVRRVHLDVLGTLPSASEAKEFLADRRPDKRRLLIDRLLEREERADYLAMKWSDVLRIKAEFPINLWPNAAQAYFHWIRQSIRENKPYDRFARELLTSSGSNFRVPPVNFYRAIQSREPAAIAQAVALGMMGQRADKWPKERLAGMAVFFSKLGYKSTGEWKEEIVFFDPSLPGGKDSGDRAAASQAAVFPDGKPARLAPDRDPRAAFADWLIRADNPCFARSIVNRVWFWLQGRGIVHEPDDIRPDNPASNPELLAYLERELVESGYDLKHVQRLILNSTTYQLSCLAKSKRPEAEADFAYYPMRRLEAEVLLDALCQVTGTTERFSSPIPEPYTFLPDGYRSIALPDGSITSAFLETFGRPPRDTGYESERNNRITASQRLHLLNSSHVQQKLERSPRLQELLAEGRQADESIEGIYLTVLSRHPMQDERKAIQRYGQDTNGRREAMIDLFWALINSAEFMYRH